MLPGPLVSGQWLVNHLEQVHVADVRWYLDGRSGRDAYRAGHLPGAVFVDLDRDLSAPAGPDAGRHPLPDPASFVASLARLGLSPERPVVAYDDASGSIAARLWWMLEAIGRPAAVLDGGIGAWPASLEAGEPASPAAGADPAFPAGGVGPEWPSGSTVTTDEVDRRRGQADVVVLDARSPARYQGLKETIDVRPGHIPGASNHPWADNVDSDGRFLPPAALRARFEAAGAGGDRPVIMSCGSGVTACHNLLALRVAGLPGAALYVGSWSAWAAHPDLPSATGPDPG